jgi:hypothetical protein
MAAVRLRLLPQDYGFAQRNNASACLLAVALAREYGGQWSVTPGRAVQVSGGYCRLRLGLGARRALIRFDATGTMARRGTTVTLYGKPPGTRREQNRTLVCRSPRPGQQRRSRLGTMAGVTSAVSLALIGDGLAWVLIAAAGLVIAVFAVIAGVRIRGALAGRDASPGLSGTPDARVPQRSRGTDFASGWDAGPEPRPYPRPAQATWRDDPVPASSGQSSWRDDPEPEPAGANAVWPYAPAMTPGSAPWRAEG